MPEVPDWPRRLLPHTVLRLGFRGPVQVEDLAAWRLPMEIGMVPQDAHRLGALLKQLSETLMRAAHCSQEIQDIAGAELDGDLADELDRGGRAPERLNVRRPLLDESTLSVVWKNKALHLGHTRSFWLLTRLARRPNHYVTHLDLLSDVWDNDELATATIRSAIRELRRKLRRGGMGDLAAAIRGHNGRYILDL